MCRSMTCLILLFPLFAGTLVAKTEAAEDFSFYPSDEFNDSHVRPRWAIDTTGVRMQDGWLCLVNPSGWRGGIRLRSVWSFGTKIPLRWPWAMQTRMVCPQNNSLAGSPMAGGVTVRLGNDAGFSAEIKAGRGVGLGAGRLICSIGGTPYDDLFTTLTRANASEMFIRIEGVGEDSRDVRVGFKLSEAAPWTWTPTEQLEQPAAFAEALGFFIEPSGLGGGTSEEMTVAFDYARFEGECFKFGERGPIQYARAEVPPVPAPELRGERYMAVVPDTIDWAERAKLALNAILGMTDPEADYEPYCHVYFNPWGWNDANNAYNLDMERGAPVMLHDFHGYNTGIGEGIIESIPLLWAASGSRKNIEVGLKMLETIRRMIGEDGVAYVPLKGRPWALFLTWWLNPVSHPESIRTYPISILTAWQALQPSPVLEREIRLMSGDAIQGGEMLPVHVGKVLGYAPALEVARSSVEPLMNHYAEDGSWSGHFHVHTMELLSLADVGAFTGDQALLEKTRKAYEFAKTKGWPLVGMFPEATDMRPYTCESCGLGEMIRLAIKLSRAGAGDLWDDADRWARNQFAEQQLIDTSWISGLAARIPRFNTPTPPDYPGLIDVEQKLVGAFSAYGTINEWTMFSVLAPGGPVGCCTGNGARAVFYLWRYSLEAEPDGALRVNLLMNRASQWADVNSYLPYEGKVVVKMKKTMPLWVHIPEWTSPAEVRCVVDDSAAELRAEGRYVSPGEIQAGQAVTFAFPNPVREVSTRIGEIDCKLTIKGNTVIAVDPPGRICPIYQRARYAAEQAPMKKIERYAPEQEFEW